MELMLSFNVFVKTSNELVIIYRRKGREGLALYIT